MRNPDGPQEVHGVPQLAAFDVLIAFKLDTAYFDLRPFAHNECHADRCRWNGSNFGADGGELVPVLSQQLPDDDFRFLDLGGIVLRLGRDSDLFLFETVEDVALGNRIDPNIADFLNSGSFLDVDVQNPAFGSGFTLNANVLEVVCIPERVEVALDSSRVVDVSGTSEDVGANCLGGNAAVAVDLDSADDIGLLLGEKTASNAQHKQKQPDLEGKKSQASSSE